MWESCDLLAMTSSMARSRLYFGGKDWNLIRIRSSSSEVVFTERVSSVAFGASSREEERDANIGNRCVECGNCWALEPD